MDAQRIICKWRKRWMHIAVLIGVHFITNLTTFQNSSKNLSPFIYSLKYLIQFYTLNKPGWKKKWWGTISSIPWVKQITLVHQLTNQVVKQFSYKAIFNSWQHFLKPMMRQVGRGILWDPKRFWRISTLTQRVFPSLSRPSNETNGPENKSIWNNYLRCLKASTILQ